MSDEPQRKELLTDGENYYDPNIRCVICGDALLICGKGMTHWYECATHGSQACWIDVEATRQANRLLDAIEDAERGYEA